MSVAKARCGGRYSVRGGKGVFRREMVRGEDIDDQRDGENKEVGSGSLGGQRLVVSRTRVNRGEGCP